MIDDKKINQARAKIKLSQHNASVISREQFYDAANRIIKKYNPDIEYISDGGELLEWLMFFSVNEESFFEEVKKEWAKIDIEL